MLNKVINLLPSVGTFTQVVTSFATHKVTKIALASLLGLVGLGYLLLPPIARRMACRMGYSPSFPFWVVETGAALGDPRFQVGLAERYERGIGVEVNKKLSHEWLQKAAESGLADAQFCFGATFVRDKQFDKGFEWIGKAAAQGHPTALFDLGWSYYSGKGNSKSLVNAFECFKKAVDHGCIIPQTDLVKIYLTTWKVLDADCEKNMLCGLEDKKDPLHILIHSYCMLGSLFYIQVQAGQKETPPQTENKNAQERIGSIFLRLAERNEPSDRQRALFLYRTAAELGNVQAQEKTKALQAHAHSEPVQKLLAEETLI